MKCLKDAGGATLGVLAWLHWYRGHHCGTRKRKKNVTVPHCLLMCAGCMAATVLAGPLWSLCHWQRKGKGGVEPATWFTAASKSEAQWYFWLYVVRTAMNYLCTLQMQTYLELILFVLFSLIGLWLGLVARKTIQVMIAMACRYLCFYSTLPYKQPVDAWKQ